ncbi:hypothetical protein HOLleu_34597 [Holothuria leucospilota]|uniref:Uncharacterized protein n=1 Tax=Holothuria leucospilota TaxID=206669 RepID=A0A9Q0YLA1_HOLLE|nr:hypothetical protein HOLleu_34597 [Holothuria leucospilota]
MSWRLIEDLIPHHSMLIILYIGQLIILQLNIPVRKYISRNRIPIDSFVEVDNTTPGLISIEFNEFKISLELRSCSHTYVYIWLIFVYFCIRSGLADYIVSFLLFF